MKTVKRLLAVVLIIAVILPVGAITANAQTTVTSIVLGVGEKYTLPSEVKVAKSYDHSVISIKNSAVTGLAEGVTRLRYQGRDGKIRLYRFTVKKAPTAVTLNATKKDLISGQTFNLRYQISEGFSGKVTYSVNDKRIAIVNSKGQVYAKCKGTAVVTAKAYNGVKATCTFTITDSVVRLELPIRHLNLPVSGKYTLKAYINKSASANVTWKSSDTSVATVSGNQLSAAVTAKKAGKATITVSAPGGVKATCTINVTTTKTSDTLKKQINSLPLYPIKTGYAALDSKVESIFKSIFKSGYTTYDKLVAVYDYEIKTFSYAYTDLSQSQWNAFENNKNNQPCASYADSLLARRAYETLVTKEGVCYNYAAIFTVMMRAVGLEVFSIDGTSTYADGHWDVHTWNNILINGRHLLFDAQVDDNIYNKLGYILYDRFGMTDSESTTDYRYKNSDRLEDLRLFKYFDKQKDFSVTLKLTGGGKTWTKSFTYPSEETYYADFVIRDVNYIGPMTYTLYINAGSGEYYFEENPAFYDENRSYCLSCFYGSFFKNYYHSWYITDAATGRTILIEIE